MQGNFAVDCSNAGLESVPKWIPSRTMSLDLNNNKIQVLNNDSFVQSKGGGLLNLIAVSIRSNQLKKIEINAFQGLNNLKILDLYNNSLEMKDSYPKSVFVPISQSLEVLDMQMNLLGDISQTDYPVSVGELVGLRELRIDCLQIKSLPTEYAKLVNLAKISFSGGRKPVGYVAENMFLTVSDLGVTDIDFAGLDIGFIGNNTFLNLPKLKTLDLSNNKHLNNIIDYLPALNQTSIETLMLNNTGMGQELTLTSVLKEVGRLHLKKLTLDNNTIDYLKPIHVEYVIDLEVFSAGNNFVHDALALRQNVINMKHLFGLNMSWQQKFTGQINRMSLLQPFKGSSLQGPVNEICASHMICPLNFPPNIQWIDLSHTSMGTIRGTELALIENISLKSLDVSYNQIHFIENRIYCQNTNTSSVVPQIETMNFNNNALQCITSDFLKHCDCSSLKRIFLRNNKLGQTEGNSCNKDKNNILGFSKYATNLEVLDLAGNQI